MTLSEQSADIEVRTEPIVTRAVIIGSGFSGLGMGIALRKQGFGVNDFLILEKADEIFWARPAIASCCRSYSSNSVASSQV